MTDDTPTGLRDGFVGDRRVRPANFFQLDIGAPNRNFIHIWLPEAVSCAGEKRWFTPRGETAGRWTSTEHGTRFECDLPGPLRMTSSVEEIAHGVELRIDLVNDTGRALDDVKAQSCVQLAAAPDFRDVELQRTLWHGGGQWRPFHVTSRPQEGRCVFYGHDGEADLPLIVVESATGPFAAGLIFRGADSVSGNCGPSIACIHSTAPGRRLEAERTLTQDGRLFIHPEGKDAVLALAEAFMAAS